MTWPNRIRSSLFLKLLLLMLVLGGLLNALVIGGFRRAFHQPPFLRAVGRANLSFYLDRVVEELGVPPDRQRAEALSRQLQLGIGVQGPGETWIVGPTDLTFEEARGAHYHRGVGVGWSRRRFFLTASRGRWRYLLVTPQAPMREEEGLITALLVTLTLIAGYFALRRLLRPVRWLREATRAVGGGDLAHQVPVRGHDELADLARAFNDMTAHVREMVKSRERLLLDVSHELRSPLTRMKVALALIDDTGARDTLGREIGEMERLVEELLETHRLGSPHGGLHLKDEDLVPALRELAGEYGLEAALPPSLGVRVDSVRLLRAVRNVVENAIKYSRGAGRPVRLTAAADETGVSLEVRDWGPGIPESEREKIFEPFYRVDKARARATGGFGLGLSLARAIAEAHGGTLTATSREGEGTAFTLRLPRLK